MILLKVTTAKNLWFALLAFWWWNQTSRCNGCYVLIMMFVNISDIVIIAINNVDYCCIIHNISKSEAINLLGNSVLEICRYI